MTVCQKAEGQCQNINGAVLEAVERCLERIGVPRLPCYCSILTSIYICMSLVGGRCQFCAN